MKMSLIVKNVGIQIKYAPYHMMIYNCTAKSYDLIFRFLAMKKLEICSKHIENEMQWMDVKNYETYNRSARLLFSNKCLSSNIKQV